MKPAENSQTPPDSQPLNSNQTFVYDLPDKEPDLNTQPWDPDYSYTTPEGTGGEVKLPADTSTVMGPTPGEQVSLFILIVPRFN